MFLSFIELSEHCSETYLSYFCVSDHMDDADIVLYTGKYVKEYLEEAASLFPDKFRTVLTNKVIKPVP